MSLGGIIQALFGDDEGGADSQGRSHGEREADVLVFYHGYVECASECGVRDARGSVVVAFSAGVGSGKNMGDSSDVGFAAVMSCSLSRSVEFGDCRGGRGWSCEAGAKWAQCETRGWWLSVQMELRNSARVRDIRYAAFRVLDPTLASKPHAARKLEKNFGTLRQTSSFVEVLRILCFRASQRLLFG